MSPRRKNNLIVKIGMMHFRAIGFAVIIVLACLVFQASTTVLYAQDGGLFTLQRPKLGLRAQYRLTDEKRQTPYDTNDTTHRDLRESVLLETRGWIYHPDLLDFHLAFEPEWRQERFQQSQTTMTEDLESNKNTSILNYDVGATLLQRKPVSLYLFANRKAGDIDFTTIQDSDIENDTWGTRLNFTNSTLPGAIAWTHRKFDQTGFYYSSEERDEAQLRLRHNAKMSTTQLNLFYYDTSRTTRIASETAELETHIESESTSTELTNAYLFKDDDSARLDSLVYNMDADYAGLDRNTWIVTENLYWQYGKNLFTRYRGNYSRREYGDAVNQEESLHAALTHHFRDRLTTDLGAGADFNDFEGGSEDSYRGDLGFLYRHPIAIGNVALGAAYDYGVSRRGGLQNTIPADTRLTLSTGSASLLEEENIDPGSILVTDLTGTIIYTENIDYQVQEVGQDLQISRIVTGAIAEGQQVAVHYNYRIDTGYDDAQFGQTYRFELSLWSLFNLTCVHNRIDQDFLSGEPPKDPRKDTRDTVDLSLYTRWTDTRLHYDQQNRSNDNSSVTRRIDQRINLRPVRTILFNFTGNIGDRRFTDIDERERFYSLGGTLRWTPLSWCDVNGVYLYNHTSSDRKEEFDTQIASTIKLTYGIWTGSATFRLRDQNDRQNGNRLQRQEVMVVLRRSLW